MIDYNVGDIVGHYGRSNYYIVIDIKEEQYKWAAGSTTMAYIQSVMKGNGVKVKQPGKIIRVGAAALYKLRKSKVLAKKEETIKMWDSVLEIAHDDMV